MLSRQDILSDLNRVLWPRGSFFPSEVVLQSDTTVSMLYVKGMACQKMLITDFSSCLHPSSTPNTWIPFPFCSLLFTNPFLLQFSLTLSPPLALPHQLSAPRVCLPALTTVPPSPRPVAAPAGTSNSPSPRASRNLPSVHRATLHLLLPPPSICLRPVKAPTLLPRHQTPPQLQPPHRPHAAWGPKGLKPLRHDPRPPPAHWPQVPSNQTIR